MIRSKTGAVDTELVDWWTEFQECNDGERRQMISDFKMSKGGQVTIFVILVIVIVAGIVLFFAFKGGLIQGKIPQELEPVYNYYLSCIEGETLDGAFILEQQAGYIEPPEFSSGSDYMPFSSELDFLGMGVPYWYYISGNGISNEQIPSKGKMKEQLNDYIEEGINLCDFSQFEAQGFEIEIGESSVDSFIRDTSISVNVNQNLNINYGDTNWRGVRHSISANSNLGKFYDLAKKIYQNNKEEMFLENYGVDILRLYAPVDGSEIGCSPKIWQVENVRNDLINALETNIPAIKVKGDYYDLNKRANKYFVQDIGKDVDINVNFMYLAEWPMKMEVWPSEDNILIAEPIGLQEGMGMLGFCYVPYHFVYDFAYPVLIQIYSGAEMFQFPVVVFINKNNPREALDAQGLPDVVPELCQKKNTQLTVSTYNTHLGLVEANIKFKCFDTVCDIGKIEIDDGDSSLTADFPQCVNGYILASAEGYKTEKHLISTINPGSVTVILDKIYELDLEVQKVGSVLSNDYAVVTFTKDDEVKSVAYPEMNKIKLTEGQYEIKVYVYSDSNINLKGSLTHKCVDVPKTGVLGIFGITEEKCFDLEVPDQIISFAVSGGGTQNYYIAESELEDSNKLIINADSFTKPTKVEDLQTNYNYVDTRGLDVVFE